MSANEAAQSVNLTGGGYISKCHPKRISESHGKGKTKRDKKEREFFQSFGNADLISFCPSLAAIFSFLDYKGILHCKLVSRRFYNVVNQNHQTMSHFWLYLNISQDTTIDTNEDYIMVYVSTYREHTMSIRISCRSINVLLGRNHALYTAFPDPIDGLKVDSMEDGLCIVLEPLCHHFELVLRIHETVPTKWNSIISEIIKRKGTYLHHLQTAEWPPLGTHLRKIDSIEIKWSSNVFNCLPRMSHLSHVHLLLPDPRNSTAQDEILQIFTRWFSGEFRIPIIKFEELGDARWLFQVPPYLVALYGHKCHHRTVPLDVNDADSYPNELFIRRPMDNVTLCLAYSDFNEIVYSYDTVVSEHEFESMRIDYTQVD